MLANSDRRQSVTLVNGKGFDAMSATLSAITSATSEASRKNLNLQGQNVLYQFQIYFARIGFNSFTVFFGQNFLSVRKAFFSAE